MFGQPRCREWTPLATQQLRLRTLLQIVGYNMYGNDGSCVPGSLYYTLHTTTMSAPFYTSEKLLSNHPKWREIDSELIHKMSSLNVVVRVWKHVRHGDKTTVENDPNGCNRKTDQIIQTWGVNFSGLLHIGANLNLDFSAKSFKDNTLIFQMSGGYFCSYDKLRLQAIPKRLKIDPNCSTAKRKEGSPSKIIPIENKKKNKESKSVSPGRINWKNEVLEGKYVSKSQSPPGNENFKHHTMSERRTANIHSGRMYLDSLRERSYCESESIYEHSPKSDTALEIREYSGSESSNEYLKSSSSRSASNRDLTSIEESEAAENYDSNIPPIPKYRYLNMKFLTSEIRPSYNAEKLRKLHQLQFSIKNRIQAVQEIKEKIYQKSALENCESLSPHDSCADYESFSRSEDLSISCREYSLLTGKYKMVKSKIFSEENEMEYDTTKQIEKQQKLENSSYQNLDKLAPTDRRFTIKLNKLLDVKAQPSPSQRLRHACLTRQIELGRFKKRLLQDERDAALAKIRHLKSIQVKLFEENQDKGSDLMQKYHSLSKKWEQLKELHKSEAALRELCLRSSALLQSRRWSLVQDIPMIYPIKENEQGKLSILDIHLPACQGANDGLRQVPEADLAVALGRVAHAVAMAASLLSVPLRHPLKLMGSRTKVLDHLAVNQNEIPLFARNKDSMMFRYGLFLLNRNIVQLLWATHRYITPNPRDTLVNLQRLLTPPLNNLDLETSRTFGSASSVETAGATGYGLFHPLSAPALTAENISHLQRLGSSPTSSGAIRKVSHNSLRSLVAVGTDRTARNIVSGGFNNIGNRQFNRFKESVDGHSPKAAMVIKKHRYSRSVGSYVDEQSFQSYEISPTSAHGSEPSLLIHGGNCDVQLSENDLSDSPSENAENIMSFSESDLTKVSDLTSPEANGGRVIFSVGDDGQLSDSEKGNVQVKRVSKQRSLDEVPSQSVSSKNKAKYQPQETPNLQVNVVELCKELEQLCSNYYTQDGVSENDSLTKVPLKTSDDKIKEHQNTNSDEHTENNSKINKPEIIISKNESPNPKWACSLPNSNDCQHNIVDIEKLDGVSYCDESCSQNCSKIFEKIPQLDSSNEEAVDPCDEVIVLPSAEAVLTASSHFTDSLRHLDEENSDKISSSTFNLETDPRVLNEIFSPTDKSNNSCNDPPLSKSEESSQHTNQSECDNSNSCDEIIIDRASICEGDNASKDANELLESIHQIEETEFGSKISNDFQGDSLKNELVMENVPSGDIVYNDERKCNKIVNDVR